MTAPHYHRSDPKIDLNCPICDANVYFPIHASYGDMSVSQTCPNCKAYIYAKNNQIMNIQIQIEPISLLIHYKDKIIHIIKGTINNQTTITFNDHQHLIQIINIYKLFS